MKKKLIKLTEQDLHNIIKESVKRAIKEGTTDVNVNNMWNKAIKIMGADAMLDELYNYLDDITIADFISTLESQDVFYEY